MPDSLSVVSPFIVNSFDFMSAVSISNASGGVLSPKLVIVTVPFPPFGVPPFASITFSFL